MPGATWRVAITLFSPRPGITKGDLLEGISRKGNIATTETLLIRGKSRTIRRIQSIHYLDRKDPDVQAHIL
ncbi:glycerol metabolic protein [Salmonella enterica subsp. salamae]|uniref:fructose-bisphosphatase n=1 Tax=Salmonella enterica subsp. salamae TaxID=59202 RepID=A0A6D2GFN3_SALER|nr:glycerol metabolic protein [Salmonella enterica subsp. salamae]